MFQSQKKLCNCEGHDKSLLDTVCLQQQCKANNFICQICKFKLHDNHLTVPLKVYLKCRKTKITSNSFKFYEDLEKQLEKEKTMLSTQIENCEKKVEETMQRLKQKVQQSFETFLQPIKTWKFIKKKKIKQRLKKRKESMQDDSSSSDDSFVNKNKSKHKDNSIKTKRNQRSRDKIKNTIIINQSSSELVNSSGVISNTVARKSVSRLSTQKSQKKSIRKEQKYDDDNRYQRLNNQKTSKKNQKLNDNYNNEQNANQKGKIEEQESFNSQNRYSNEMKYNPKQYSQEELKRQFLKQIGGRKDVSKIILHRKIMKQNKKHAYQFLLFFAGEFQWKQISDNDNDWNNQKSQYWKDYKSNRNK